MLSKRFKYDGKECEKLNDSQLKAKQEIIKKISDNFYKFEEINCPICDNNEIENISEKDKYGIPHNVGICKKCGFIFANKRMDKNSYTNFYIHHFNDLDIGYSVGFDESFRSQYENARNSIYPFVSDCIDLFRNLNVLEVGCSSGGAIQYFKEMGHNVFGLDLGIDAIEYGKNKYGLNLINIDLPDYNADIKFDLVIYNSVFEHIGDVKSHMIKLHEIMAENGKLFLRVPGIKNLHKNSFHKFDLLNFITLPHIYYFSVKTLTNLMNKHQFRHLKSNEIIFSVFEKADFNSTFIPDTDYIEVASYLRKQDNVLKIKIKNLLYKVKLLIKKILDYVGLLVIMKKMLGKI